MLRQELPKTIESSTGQKFVVYNFYTRSNTDYTQGLYVIPNGAETKILQSTGEYSKSKIMYNSLDETSNLFTTLNSINLPSTDFGEGTEVIEDKIVQLTWTTGNVYVRNRDTLAIEKTLRLPGEIAEGWGITYDSTKKIAYITDGSTKVYLCTFPADFSSMSVQSSVITPYSLLNELEFVETDKILANRYQTNFITKLNLANPTEQGSVTWDMVQLLKWANVQMHAAYNVKLDKYEQVLNGIAKLHGKKGTVQGEQLYLVTGKNWPVVFTVGFLEN